MEKKGKGWRWSVFFCVRFWLSVIHLRYCGDTDFEYIGLIGSALRSKHLETPITTSISGTFSNPSNLN